MNYMQGLASCEVIMQSLEDHFDIAMNHKNDTQHIKNVYKQMTNIKGNIGTLMKDSHAYSHRTNREQLNDGIYKLFTIILQTDPWYDECHRLIKNLYDWATINRMIDSSDKATHNTLQQKASILKTYERTYGRLLTSLSFTETELIQLITRYPYLSRIYKGPFTIVNSIGAMLI